MLDFDEDEDEYPYDPDDDWVDEEWWNDGPEGWEGKEVPDCSACCDTGAVHAGRLYALLVRRDYRRCRACTPNFLWYWRWRAYRHLGLPDRWRYSRIGQWWRRVRALATSRNLAGDHPDGWKLSASISCVAATSSPRGCALRAAMAADDTDLMGELSGRTWTRLHKEGR